ncbi:unnamed protein product [Heligmosomoides polygyrus]|uniref:DUF3362 domain-containing protein n=1 Tax=Heligmosomoides polygyrus TaxID=6339 RepID=A0A183GEY0_HELPZ|nr:unnamed protein product [Heligmosomoides polygyrus]
MEAKMLRWTAGVTRMDRIRNDVIRQKFGVAPIADKMREARLRWKSGPRYEAGQTLKKKRGSAAGGSSDCGLQPIQGPGFPV